METRAREKHLAPNWRGTPLPLWEVELMETKVVNLFGSGVR